MHFHLELADLSTEEQLDWIKWKKSELEWLIWIAENLANELEKKWIHFEKPKIPKLWDNLVRIILEYGKIYTELTWIIANLKSIKWESNEFDIKSHIETDKIFLERLISATESLINELENKWIVFNKPVIPEIPKWDDLDKLTIEYLHFYTDLEKIIKYLLSKKWITWEEVDKFIQSIDYPENDDEK